jgi:putative FmdB family regulatory protein
MPTYAYNCPICGEFEVFHSIKEDLSECPHCAEKGVKSTITRLILSGNFILQGSGWAKDNYSK